MLVLGLVSTASATLKELYVASGATLGTAPDESAYVDADDTIDMMTCTYLWIGIRNHDAGTEDDAGMETMWLGFDDTSNGEWTTNYTMQYMTDHPSEWNNVLYTQYNAWWCNLAAVSTYLVPVGIMDAKEFHCTAVSDVTVTLLDEAGENVYDSFVIHQIPEPMTLALLGLGGLLLRRRK